jgi:hypothetical protein
MLVWQPIGSASSAASGLILTGRRYDWAEFPLSAFAGASFVRMTDGLRGILLSKPALVMKSAASWSDATVVTERRLTQSVI